MKSTITKKELRAIIASDNVGLLRDEQTESRLYYFLLRLWYKITA